VNRKRPVKVLWTFCHRVREDISPKGGGKGDFQLKERSVKSQMLLRYGQSQKKEASPLMRVIPQKQETDRANRAVLKTAEVGQSNGHEDLKTLQRV